MSRREIWFSDLSDFASTIILVIISVIAIVAFVYFANKNDDQWKAYAEKSQAALKEFREAVNRYIIRYARHEQSKPVSRIH